MSKSLIRLCASLRTLPQTSRHLGAIRLCHSQNETKELTTDLATVSQKTPSEAKQLFDLFTKDKNPISLIINIEANKDKIDGRHVVVALTSMYKFYESNKYPAENVTNSPQFTKMCNILNKHIRTLEMPQVLQSLKILNLFKVHSSTTIVQNLLQMIRVSVNDLNPHEIYFLAFMLKQMRPSHLGNAIYTALPEVFEARIKTKIDVDDLIELSNALKFATHHTKAEGTSNFLVQKILKYNGPMDTTSAIKIFQSLCKKKDLEGSRIVLDRIYDVILKNIDNLTEFDVKLVISETCAQTLKGYDAFYNPLFLDQLINQIIRNNYGLDYGFKVLGRINNFYHIHLALLKYLTSKLQSDPYLFTVAPKTMAILAQGLANSNYKPSNWEDLKNAIFKNYKRLPDHVSMAYLALYVAALDDCDFSMIEHVFKMDQNNDLLTNDYRQTLCHLYQIVKTLHPEYTGAWPIDEILNSFKTFQSKYEPTDYPLTPSLTKIVEDPACLKTNVRTNLGHHIDHLVVLQNGSPVPIESNAAPEDSNASCFVEDLNIPQDCTRVAICLLPPHAYNRNIAIAKADVRLKKKTLEAMSYNVVFISEDIWASMPEMERIPYLEHTIGIEKKSRQDKRSEVSSATLAEASR